MQKSNFLLGMGIGVTVGSIAVATMTTGKKTSKNIIGKTQTWYICFPAPLSCYYKWTGELQPLPVTGVGVNEVLKTTIYITVQDELNGPNEPGEQGVGGTYANSSDAEKITKAAG